jgi:hypothetical protein
LRTGTGLQVQDRRKRVGVCSRGPHTAVITTQKRPHCKMQVTATQYVPRLSARSLRLAMGSLSGRSMAGKWRCLPNAGGAAPAAPPSLPMPPSPAAATSSAAMPRLRCRSAACGRLCRGTACSGGGSGGDKQPTMD